MYVISNTWKGINKSKKLIRYAGAETPLFYLEDEKLKIIKGNRHSIGYKKSDASLKNLTDKIKNRLLKNHQSGGHTMLVIDEAQHLAPAVLEQLRLLTNLETKEL